MARRTWTRDELLVAGFLYCRIPFGRFHSSNPEIVRVAQAMDRTPGALAMKLSNLASVDPTFRSSGRSGLPGASANDRALWQEMNADWPTFALKVEAAVGHLGIEELGGQHAEQPETTGEAADYTGAERVTTRRERVGQGLFRDSVLSAYDFRCCITGLALPGLLNASHIVPWREDPGNRLNPANGLCLSALHDRAFDKGLITILEDLTVAVATNVSRHAGPFFDSTIGIYEGQPIAAPEKFSPAPGFLAHHRAEVFVG
jgi:hypothetical protein